MMPAGSDLTTSAAFTGRVWRGHRSQHPPLDTTGSTITPGRFHVVRAESRNQPGWPALYTALDLAVALGEIVRSDPGERLKQFRFTEIQIALEHVADCRNLQTLGIDPDLLFDDWDFSTGQALAWTVHDAGGEGMLVPSATRLGDNLIVFPDRLRTGSTLEVVRTVDPDLTKGPR